MHSRIRVRVCALGGGAGATGDGVVGGAAAARAGHPSPSAHRCRVGALWHPLLRPVREWAELKKGENIILFHSQVNDTSLLEREVFKSRIC